MQAPPTSVESTQRRIRVRLRGTVVADTTRALLLVEYGPGRLPTYYVPLADVRPDALVDDKPALDGRRRWAVTDGRARADVAAWEHPDPTGDLAGLAGHITFSWERLEWFEEDERVVVHARDPHHRVDTLRSSRRVEVYIKGERVANSTRPVVLFETWLPTRFYLPYEDLRMDLLTASNTISYCPYKGQARYWSHPEVPNAAWSYPDPIPENPKIRELVSFYNEKVDMVIDGVPVERPDSPFA